MNDNLKIGFCYADPLQKIEEYTIIFNSITRKFKIPIIIIIDHDLINRLTSFEMTNFRYGRFYHRYGIFVIYKYNKSILNHDYSLLDVKIYRFFNADKIYQIYDYEVYFRSLLLFYLPNLLKIINKNYRVVFLNSFPPFVEEDHSIIRQDKNVEDNIEYLPLLPKPGYLVIEIENEQYICKMHKYSNLFSGHSGQKNEEGIYITSWVSPCSILLAMKKQHFLEKFNTWLPLDLLLTGKTTKRESILFNRKDKNLNSYSYCEDIFDPGCVFVDG